MANHLKHLFQKDDLTSVSLIELLNFIITAQWNYETLIGCVNYNQKQLKFYSYKFFHLIVSALFCCESRYGWEIASNLSMPNTLPCRDLVSFALVIFSRFRDYLGHFSAQTRKIKIKQNLRSEKIYFIFSKNVFLIFWENGTLTFWEIELPCPKIKKFQEETF